MTSQPINWSPSDQTQINECLDHVLLSPVFEKSPRQQDLLRYLVKETLAGNAHRLKGYTLGVEIFGRSADFDPSADAIVRVQIGRLRTMLREYYMLHGQSEAVLFALPKGSYAIDITFSDSLKISAQTSAAMSDSVPNSIEHDASLAVLPFTNLGPSANHADSEHDYFSDGLTDNLIYELSRLSGLFIISRQSSFNYRGTIKSPREIGAELGVKYLLEGNVQLSGKRVRVTARLIEASTGGYLWSERYESTLHEIFALQDEITLGIVKALQIKLAWVEAELFGHEGTESIEAHDALLRGMACHWKYTPKYVAEARTHFARAVEIDPMYAAAHAWLARSILFQWVMRWDLDANLKELAYDHAQKAVALNSHLPYALSILGWAHLWLKQRDPSISACRQAVALDPNNAEAQLFLSFSLSAAGRGEEALFYIEKALRHNPHSSTFYEFTLGQAYFVLKNYNKAIAAYKRGCELSETFPPNHIFLCSTYALMGMEDEMRSSREIVLAIMGGDKSKMIEPPWLDEELAQRYEQLLQYAGLK